MKRALRIPTLFAVAISLTLLSWAATPVPAQAASPCVGARSNYFDGKLSTSTNTYGSFARISTVFPALCSGGSTFSNAWSMLASQIVSGYAQSGYVKDTIMSQTIVYYFAQWKRGNGYAPETIYTSPGPASGAVTVYKTTINANGYIEMYRSTTLMARSLWKPVGNWGNQPYSNQYFGETGHCQTDVPGLQSNKAHLTDIRRQTFLGSGWFNPNDLVIVKHCGSRYQLATTSTPGSIAFDIWSTP